MAKDPALEREHKTGEDLAPLNRLISPPASALSLAPEKHK